MTPKNVDLVLLVDASESMRPCFTELREHLNDLLYPLEQANFKVRFGLVAYAAAPGQEGAVYDHTFIGGSGAAMLEKLYDPQVDQNDFFTADPSQLTRILGSIEAQGNENTLLAIDIAADFPFGPPDTTRRVIAVFTDEMLEDGVTGDDALNQIPALIQKLMDRRIQLFVSGPYSEALGALGSLEGSRIQTVRGSDGLQSVDFEKLLAQMGKSISIASLQAGNEPSWQRAIFGQDTWTPSRSVTAANRSVVLDVGETANFSAASPITLVTVKLEWTAAVDLDLHAFFIRDDGRHGWINFSHKNESGIRLDLDAGVGGKGGRNVENITLTTVDRFVEILFATKIFKKGGTYADYDGRVSILTNSGDEMVVPLTSTERADWCVIAKMTNSGGLSSVTNLNEVTDETPDLSRH